ncbi:hypothetical protein BpHYR1_033622 [Brachionus plicatilis]|uniref:Uncharacterized protein n=1 Tax=Brachionus plicatilis TaxID=10195 RepID=A0A3M7SYR1_BRAPC|nr:hypothetical protein BpHYR1_033622 [Brachionus plicatilis]
MITGWGFAGTWGSRSMTTFLGGGGSRFPEMVMIFLLTGAGGVGGASRMTIGSGVVGLCGVCRMMIGGAGELTSLGSWLMMMSPGGGTLGGFKYLMASSWMYSIFW